MRRKGPSGQRTLCIATGERKPLQIAGYVLLAVGALVLFLCIPCWAWVALLGAVLLGLGVLLLTISKAGR